MPSTPVLSLRALRNMLPEYTDGRIGLKTNDKHLDVTLDHMEYDTESKCLNFWIRDSSDEPVDDSDDDGKPYTFEQFQASGRDCDDLSGAIEGFDQREEYTPRGRTYLGGSCWIEDANAWPATSASRSDGRWTTIIGTSQPQSDSLEEIERKLYDWCISNRFELVPYPTPPVAVPVKTNPIGENAVNLYDALRFLLADVKSQADKAQNQSDWQNPATSESFWVSGNINRQLIRDAEHVIRQCRPNTVQSYFYDKIGAELPDNITVIALDSPCGADCKMAIDGAAMMIGTLDLGKHHPVVKTITDTVSVLING